MTAARHCAKPRTKVEAIARIRALERALGRLLPCRDCRPDVSCTGCYALSARRVLGAEPGKGGR